MFSITASGAPDKLRNYRFASDSGRLQFSNRPGARSVQTLSTIQEGNDNTGVEQDRLHRPKSLKWSRTRDSNLPRPVMPCQHRPYRRYCVALSLVA